MKITKPNILKIQDMDNSISPVATMEGYRVNCKIQYRPDGELKISCFDKPVFRQDRDKERDKDTPVPKRLKLFQVPKWVEHAMRYVDSYEEWDEVLQRYVTYVYPETEEMKRQRSDSIKRAKDKAFEIGLSNDFEYFITLTLDEKKIDRYDKEAIYPKLRNWLSDRVKRNAMDYLLFPEYHKLKPGEETPAIHFHMLSSAEGLHMTDSGKVTRRGQPVYNLDGWKYGYSTAIRLDGCSAVVKYVTKYITKDNQKIFGRYYYSGGCTLKRELPADYLNIDFSLFKAKEVYIPQANMYVKYKMISFGDDTEDEGCDDDDVLEEP